MVKPVDCYCWYMRFYGSNTPCTICKRKSQNELKGNRMKITAREARKLAGVADEQLIKEEVEKVYSLIRNAANDGRRILKLYTDFWVNGGYKSSPEWKAATKMLQDDGFSVKFYYEELQFVDMYTIVEW